MAGGGMLTAFPTVSVGGGVKGFVPYRYVFALSTGQKFQSPQEILEFFGEVEGDIAQEVEAVAEQGLERSLKGFFKGIGRSRS